MANNLTTEKKIQAISMLAEDAERLFAALELPPVTSALDAVKASILADARGMK